MEDRSWGGWGGGGGRGRGPKINDKKWHIGEGVHASSDITTKTNI